MEEVCDLLKEKGRIGLNELTIEAQEALKNNEVSVEVLNMIAFEHTDNPLILTAKTGLSNETVNKTVQALFELGYIERKMGESSTLKLPLNKEVERTRLIIQSRVKRAANQHRVRTLTEKAPGATNETLSLYPSYGSLQRRKRPDSIADLKALYLDYSILLATIQNEFAKAIEKVNSEPAKADALKQHLKNIEDDIGAIQLDMIEALTKLYESDEVRQQNKYIDTYKGMGTNELQEELNELHAQLGHLQNIPFSIDPIFSPQIEYHLRKLIELNLRIQMIERYINDPDEEVVNQEPPDTPQTAANPEPERRTGNSGGNGGEGGEPPRDIEDFTDILSEPDEAMSIEDLEREAMEEPQKPQVRQLPPEERAQQTEQAQEDAARFSRRRMLGLLAIGGAALIGGGGMLAHKALNPDTGSVDIDFPDGKKSSKENISSSSIEYKGVTLTVVPPRHEPDKLPALQKRLLKKEGAKFDKYTGNVVYGINAKRLIEEPLVKFMHPMRKTKGRKTVVEKDELILKISVAKRLIDAQKDLGKDIVIIEGFRPNETQNKWYQRKIREGRDYAVAKPGSSSHENGQAVDVMNRGEARDALIRHGLLDAAPHDPPHFARYKYPFTSGDYERSKENDAFAKSPKYKKWLKRRYSATKSYIRAKGRALKRWWKSL